MASTYSDNLGLELIGTGDQSGSWGTTLNRNLGTLLEEAITGYVTTAVVDSTVATSLSLTDGATATARHFVLELTGTLTAARTLEVPTVEKPYVVYNNTTGGFAVTVKTAAGTGISVPAGKKRFLMVNGTNVVDMINDLPASTTFDGATVLTSNTSNFSGTNATLSGVLIAGGVTSGDGSQGLPTFTFTQDTNTGMYRANVDTIGWTTGGTLRAYLNTTDFVSGVNFTVAGATNLASTLNVSGTTTLNSTLTTVGTTTLHSTLAVAGAANFNSTLACGGTFTAGGVATFNSVLRASSGSAAAPTYSFNATTNTGMFFDGASLAWAYAGVSRMTLNNATLSLNVSLDAPSITSTTASIGPKVTLQGPATVGSYFMFFNSTGIGTIGSINVGSNNTSTNFNTVSDGRLKPVRRDFDSGAIVDSLVVVEHNWIHDAHYWNHSLIAQDTYEVYPQAVTVGYGEPGKDGFVPWCVDNSKLVPVLLRELQELRKRVAELENR